MSLRPPGDFDEPVCTPELLLPSGAKGDVFASRDVGSMSVAVVSALVAPGALKLAGIG
jgi:hypothetical protein